ncbi:flagellar basal body rod protein FlgC [Roseovarius indicus]|uniref:Flagellar basal-body rod protein FlgC n=2 Tax=Roseovarius indicus TaxID=540747 RepID=A0A5P3ABC4_9RHOB|nr:flagellar basal body rod protein FlgC [Roseovarius indicus]QEW25605.1 Putative proximal rod protein [Roseovarius indicus]SFE02051.1 flagellar basal-body rod protein FlgC [Roseovarius indicus]
MDSLKSISAIAASGMRAQSERLRIVSENVANSSSTAEEAGGDPYRRKTVSFGSTIDPTTGAAMVELSKIGEDTSGFRSRYDPAHPAADENGYVKLPNVNPLIEMSNMREAARSYETNLSMLENASEMRSLLIDLLK